MAQTTRPTPPSKLPITLSWIAAAIVFALCVWGLGADWARLLGLPEAVVRYFGLLGQDLVKNPFEAPQSEWWQLSITYMLDSLYIAWVGTLVGAIVSLPLGFLAARNVAPAWITAISRTILNVIRAIPDFIFAIVLLLPLYGFDKTAGALALGIGSVGTLGKLTSEAIEGLRLGPVDALRATGASHLSVLRWGMLPQVLPEIISFWLYRFEVNIRAGAILGALGLGGIGFLLSTWFNSRDWARLGIALVVTIVVTVVVDQVSAAVRHRIIAGDLRASAEKTPVVAL